MTNTCPITHEIFTDPVIAQDGHTYERTAITEWFKHNDISPMTREKIGKVLITNHAKRSELSEAGYFVKSLNKSTSVAIEKGSSLRVTLVLDVSGSMNLPAGNSNVQNEPTFSRLDLVKHAASSIANMMRENDQLSIVTFSDGASIVMNWTKMDLSGKQNAEQIAQNLCVQGGTNIPIGVIEGCKMKGDHVILLTDGANSTNPPRGTLGNYIVSQISDFTGKIHSIGLGMAFDLDTPLLREISSNKNGLYCFCPDSSMVGTVFIHLMAHICVNEPGIPFDEHDRFVDTIIRASTDMDAKILHKTKFNNPILNEDLVSSNPNKGQVEKAILNWDTWGRHYIPAFIDAHLQCVTTNFKDASLQSYATPNTRLFIDAAEAIFLDIKPPVPSCNNSTGQTVNSSQFATATMSQTGGCFGPDTKVTVMDTTLEGKQIIKEIFIKDIRKGMYVRGAESKFHRVQCVVVSPPTEMIFVEEFWISKKHPLLLRRHNNSPIWVHAESFSHDPMDVQVKKCYNLILRTGHTITIGGIDAVTLAHNMTGGIVEHDYYGSNRIIEDLSKSVGWEDGVVEIFGVKRNEKGFVCGIELGDT